MDDIPIVTLPPRDMAPQQLYPVAVQPTDVYAVVAFVMGILSFVPVFGVLFGVCAIVFGIFAIVRIKRNRQEKGKKMAAVGIVLGAVGLTLLLVYYSGADVNSLLTAYRVSTVREELAQNVGFVEAYVREHGRLPTSLSELHDAGYPAVIIDPFLRAYSYEVTPSGGYELRSAGPDRVFDTTDDIVGK